LLKVPGAYREVATEASGCPVLCMNGSVNEKNSPRTHCSINCVQGLHYSYLSTNCSVRSFKVFFESAGKRLQLFTDPKHPKELFEKSPCSKRQ
jgi:hypothetical protein